MASRTNLDMMSWTTSSPVWREVCKKPLNRVYFAVIIIAVVNFVSFFVMAAVIGGDAINGKVEGGRYLVAQHGHFRAVSQSVYTYSLWHARSVFVTHPLALLCGFLLVLDMKSVAGRLQAEHRAP